MNHTSLAHRAPSVNPDVDLLYAPATADRVRAFRRASAIVEYGWTPTLNTRSVEFSRMAEDGTWHPYIIRLSDDSEWYHCPCASFAKSPAPGFCKHIGRLILDARALGVETYPLPPTEAITAVREWALGMRAMPEQGADEYNPFEEGAL